MRRLGKRHKRRLRETWGRRCVKGSECEQELHLQPQLEQLSVIVSVPGGMEGSKREGRNPKALKIFHRLLMEQTNEVR